VLSRNCDACHCSLFDERSFEFGDRHEHTKLKLGDWIWRRGIDPLAGAD
jgi:hypothetical protein